MSIFPTNLLPILASTCVALLVLSCTHDSMQPKDRYGDLRLGNFEMTVNGEYIQGDICSRTCLDYRDCSNSKRFIFTFSDVSDDTYEIRELSFRILDNMGYHSIDTIEPKGDFVETAAWPYSTAFFSHEIEYGHVSGDEYYPIFNGSTENFISIDSIQSGTYFGHFQISLARDTSVSKLISTSEDTLYITKGHFSLRNFVR